MILAAFARSKCDASHTTGALKAAEPRSILEVLSDNLLAQGCYLQPGDLVIKSIMNKSLQIFYVATVSALLTLASGCASAPTTVSALDKQKSAPPAGAANGKTVFTEEQITSMLDDDFWGSGATASVDEEGRLTYHLPTNVVDDGNFNDAERNAMRSPNGRFYYIDPITGRPIMAVDAWNQPGIYRPRRTDGRFSDPGPSRASPRAISPSNPSRSAPVSRGTRSTQDNRD